jgi:hypothetical protein
MSLKIDFKSISDVADLLIIVGSVFLFSFGLGYARGKSNTTRKLNDRRERHRFEDIYAPIRAKLIDCHISSATFTMAPSCGSD